MQPHQRRAYRSNTSLKDRVTVLYLFMGFIGAVFIARLFYLQVIKHTYYQKVAMERQLSERSIPAERGMIFAHGSDGLLPLVLNEDRFTIAADPTIIKDPGSVAEKLSPILLKSKDDLEKLLKTPDTRYVVLAKKVTKDQKDALAALKLPGIVPKSVPYRTYPQKALASQLLGFVNDEGIGQYGIEGFLQDQLAGVPGEMKAITDAQGIPLAASGDNKIKDPIAGKGVVLTIDASLQQAAEDILKAGLETAQSKSGSLLVMDPNTGAIKAMANYPTYDPNNYTSVEDPALFQNASVSQPLEVGSVVKPLTAAAAYNEGVVNENTSYYDKSYVQIGDAKVTNIEEDGGAGTKTVRDILQLSLNTGAVYLLQQLGGGEINEKARVTWHDYLVNRYQFGKVTGIEQEGEAAGVIPSPTEGFGLPIQYANMSFGQGMTITPLQLAAATSAIVNGGTYYQPRLVDAYTLADGTEQKVEPKVVNGAVISKQVSDILKGDMEYIVSNNNLPAVRSGFIVGGKTGTAEIPKPAGGYYDDRFNGMYMGFVGVDSPKFVIVVRVNEPGIKGYAGAKAAAPIFATMSNTLIDTFGLSAR